MEKSLDDYIRENPSIVKNVRRKMVPTAARFGPQKGPSSQQWRLGRNGPRPLKRLGRNGPLRPFTRASNTDGMPRLVRKYARFPPHRPLAQRPSVFYRLGWNPMFVLAKQRVRQARQHFWRRQQFYPSRVPSSFPMGRRPYYQMYRPNYQRRQFWQWGRPKFQKPVFSGPVFSPNDQNFVDHRNDQLVKNERRRIQEEKLRNVQNNYCEEGAQMYQQGLHFNQQRNRPTLPDDASAAQYPIARDDYASSVPPERAPSPEGSIISAQRGGFRGNTQGQQARLVNPFSSHGSMGYTQGQHTRQMNNPFAQQNTSMDTGEQQMPNPYVANFRPNLPTGTMPLNQRFPTGYGYSHAQMNSSMMV